MRVIHLIRKPLSGSSVAANVLEHGTGGVNIEGCRVSMVDGDPQFRTSALIHKGMWTGDLWSDGDALVVHKPHAQSARHNQNGRWPANMVLEHRPGCRAVGTRQVATGTAVRRHGGGQAIFAGIAGGKNYVGAQPDATYADDSGMETVAAWECEPDCQAATVSMPLSSA